jgi:hypothetical protein
MSWQNHLEQQLERIAVSGELGRGSVTMSLDMPHGRLECELADLDTIGCAVNQLRLKTDALARVTLDDLRQLGQALTERVRYLLEPISNLELDQEGFSLQLRSHPPQKDDQGRRYYELTARRGGEIRLCRYEKTASQPRQRIPARLTREVLSRLAADFDAAVAPLDATH